MTTLKGLEEIILAYPDILYNDIQRDYYIYRGISIEFVLNNPHLPWKYENILYYNNKYTLEFILEVLDKLSTNEWGWWYYFTQNKCISMNDINNNPDLPWEYSVLGHNPNVTEEMIDKYRDFITGVNYNNNISIEFIKNNPHLSCAEGNHLRGFGPHSGLKFIFSGKGIQWNKFSLDDLIYIFSNKQCKIHIEYLDLSSMSFDNLYQLYQLHSSERNYSRLLLEEVFMHKDLTEEILRVELNMYSLDDLETIITNIDLISKCDDPTAEGWLGESAAADSFSGAELYYWDYEALSSNKNIKTLEDIKKFGIDQDWDWYELSLKLPLHDLDYLLTTTDKIYGWFWSRKDLTLDFILKHQSIIDLDDYVSINDNIPLEEIENHPEINWNYSDLLLHKDINLEYYNKLVMKI